MPRIAAIDRLADRRAKRKAQRQHARSWRAYQHKGRVRAVLKALACLVMLAAFAVLGFLVGSDQYQVTLIGWVPFVMVLTGIVLSGLYLLVLRRGIRFEEALSVPECRRDDDVSFTVSFKNATPLLASRLKARFFIADMFDNVANEVSTTLSLSPLEQYDLTVTTKFEHIGTFHAGLRDVTIGDFLGLFSHTQRNKTHQVVRVTPNLVELDGIEFSNEAMDEATKASRSVLADSMDYAYVREYEPGDPLKTIHWKLSARAGEYMTRLYEVYTNPSVVIIMDFYAASEGAEDLMSMFDAVVESAFSLARYARQQGMDVELRFRDRHGAPQQLRGADTGKVSEIVADLPRMSNDPADESAAVDMVRQQAIVPRGFNNIFVCSANLGSDMISAILEAKVSRRAPHMVAVVPPSLVGRERDEHCANLGQLEAADVAFSAITRATELGYAVGGDR